MLLQALVAKLESQSKEGCWGFALKLLEAVRVLRDLRKQLVQAERHWSRLELVEARPGLAFRRSFVHLDPLARGKSRFCGSTIVLACHATCDSRPMSMGLACRRSCLRWSWISCMLLTIVSCWQRPWKAGLLSLVNFGS